MSLDEAAKERNSGAGHNLAFQSEGKRVFHGWCFPHMGACGEFPNPLSGLDLASELLQLAKVGNRNVSMALVCWSDPATQT